MAINVNMTKRDLFNAKNASLSVSDAVDSGESYTVSGVALVENAGTSKSGDVCDVGYIATDAGVFGFTSKVLISALPELAEILSDALDNGEIVNVRFNSNKNSKGTDFYTVNIV